MTSHRARWRSLVPLALFAVAVQRGLGPVVGAATACRRQRGRWCTPAVCTPPSRVCCWASRVPVLGQRGSTHRGVVRAPAAARVRGLRRARVRVLRRRGDGRRMVGIGRARCCSRSRVGVLAGLVLGKPIGVFGTTFMLAKFTRASLDDDLAWRDVFGVSLLAGIGFTVSLLIGELAFGHGTPAGDRRQDRCAGRVRCRSSAGRGGFAEP